MRHKSGALVTGVQTCARPNARRGEAIALVVVPGREAAGQAHGEDVPRMFPPFAIEVNLAPFLNGENPIPFLAGAETTRLPGEKSSPQLACKGHLSSAQQYDKLTVRFGKFIVQSPALLRSEERRVVKECVRTCRSRWSAYHKKKKMSKASENSRTIH